MVQFSDIIGFVLHIDKYLGLMIQNFGFWVYAILFLILFCETGLVFTPFLPGDSLLFVSGAFAGTGVMNIWILFAVFVIAAILGDTANYWIGHYFGERVLKKFKFVKREHLEKTKQFYHKHGGKTIILARFVPIIRTFAPFVAGIGKMDYFKFISYNVIGALVWVSLFLSLGYFFGTIPWVQENLTFVMLTIIVVSFLPPIVEYAKEKKKDKDAKAKH